MVCLGCGSVEGGRELVGMARRRFRLLLAARQRGRRRHCCGCSTPGQNGPAPLHLTPDTLVAGIIAGQLSIGFFADRLGRKHGSIMARGPRPRPRPRPRPLAVQPGYPGILLRGGGACLLQEAGTRLPQYTPAGHPAGRRLAPPSHRTCGADRFHHVPLWRAADCLSAQR